MCEYAYKIVFHSADNFRILDYKTAGTINAFFIFYSFSIFKSERLELLILDFPNYYRVI